MVRNLLGALLALIGAAAVVWSPFRSWQGGRQGRAYRLQDLFTSSGVTGINPTLFTGLFLPMLVAAALAVLALALRSRVLVVLAGLVALGFAVLWMVRLGQAAGSLNVGGSGSLGEGVAYAVGGGLLLLISAVVLRGRRAPARSRGAHARTGYDDYGSGRHDGRGPDYGYGDGDRGGYGYDYGGYDDYGPQEPYGRGRSDPYGQPEPYGQPDPYGQRGPYSPVGPYGPGPGPGPGGPYGGGSHDADEPPQSRTPPYGTPSPTQHTPRPGPGRGPHDQP
jgi:hypothetical protein